MKQLFTNGTMFIANGTMLEQVKDRFFKQGYTTLWGYVQEEYKDATEVSSGYLHYEDKMFYLSQNTLDKPILSFEEFKITVVEDKKPKNNNKKRYSANELKEAMEFGFNYGFTEGGKEAPTEDTKSFGDSGVFEDWMNDNNK